MTHRVMITWAIAAASVALVTVASPAEAATVVTQSCAAPTAGAPTTSDPLASFEAVTPRRIVDTRDGTGGRSAPVGAGCTLRINLKAANVPAAAEAAALSVTALGSQPGFLTAFPCSQGRPATSNVNTRSGGFPTPNLVVAIPDAKRMVCLYSLFEAHVVIDVTGWWTTDGHQRLDHDRSRPRRRLAERPRVGSHWLPEPHGRSHSDRSSRRMPRRWSATSRSPSHRPTASSPRSPAMSRHRSRRT